MWVGISWSQVPPKARTAHSQSSRILLVRGDQLRVEVVCRLGLGGLTAFSEVGMEDCRWLSDPGFEGWKAFSEVALPFDTCSCPVSAELPLGSDGGDSEFWLHFLRVLSPMECLRQMKQLSRLFIWTHLPEGSVIWVGELFRVRRNRHWEGRVLVLSEAFRMWRLFASSVGLHDNLMEWMLSSWVFRSEIQIPQMNSFGFEPGSVV